MSFFMFCIEAAGLMFSPPVSKQTPLPTSVTYQVRHSSKCYLSERQSWLWSCFVRAGVMQMCESSAVPWDLLIRPIADPVSEALGQAQLHALQHGSVITIFIRNGEHVMKPRCDGNSQGLTVRTWG